MKLRLIPLALAIAIGSQPAPVSQQTLIGKPVGSLSLLDLDGRTARYSPAEKRVAVVVFISNRCPMSNAFNYRLNELYKDFKSQVQFLVVNSNANESLDEVRHHSQEMGYDFMVYKDLNNTVADLLGAQATPEAFAIDREGLVMYHGNIEDSPNPQRAKQHSLRMAIEAMLDGKPVPIPETHFLGCALRRARPR
jgi:hypothetical protein